jgi:hypothetical protein
MRDFRTRCLCRICPVSKTKISQRCLTAGVPCDAGEPWGCPGKSRGSPFFIAPASPQGLCLMSHFARIFFIAFTLAAASCSISEPQKEEAERKKAAQQVTSAYYSCVRTSFASQLPTMVDRNMAIDQAFLVCKTEESKLHAFENTLSGNPNVSNAAMSSHRNALKEELLRR